MTRRADVPAGRRGRVVLWGMLAHAPFGGMTWQVINHLVGLRQLGFDVWYVEDTDEWMLNRAVDDVTVGADENVTYLARYMAAIGMADFWVLRMPGTRNCHGAADWRGLLALYRDADVVLNLCGSHRLQAHHDLIRRLVYLETDPVATQVEVARGDSATISELERYDVLATYATNLYGADCAIPVKRFDWLPTVPPVASELWRTARPPSSATFTTVMNWSTPAGGVEWDGRRWEWSKRDAFRRVLNMPSATKVPLAIAMRGADDQLQNEITTHGWAVDDARTLDRPGAYRRYISASAGEFSVTKEQYVAPRSGWISDRTVCYLAAGRPAVVERTGIDGVRLGEGLLDFATPEEAVAGLHEVASDYERHARAARELAEEHFTADQVLARVLDSSQPGPLTGNPASSPKAEASPG